MKKIFIFIVLSALILTGCSSDDDKFEEEQPITGFDADFAALLESKGYIPNAKTIYPSDVKYIKQVYVDEAGLKSLAGIEYFESLTHLGCYGNELTELNISNLLELVSLGCGKNQLTKLDLSNNTKLTDFDCNSNQIKVLDISKNIKIINLLCYRNQLKSLQLNNNIELSMLHCYSNQLTDLDIRQNKKLTDFECDENVNVIRN